MSLAGQPSLRRCLSEESSNASLQSSSTVSTSKTLLFGEIPSSSSLDGSGHGSTRANTSLCNLVLSGSPTFLRFWESDQCRASLLDQLNVHTLAALRLVCHDFNNRVAPRLFEDIRCTFRANTFTKPRRIKALDRIGRHVKTFTFNMPHTAETFLPPLLDPITGDQRAFTYTPQVRRSPRSKENASTTENEESTGSSKYGSIETTELLIQQYPPIFHASTNTNSFVRAFRALTNLQHLKISCSSQRYAQSWRRSAVDYALISLRIAVERSSLPSLSQLSLHDVHPLALHDLVPVQGLGSNPNSGRIWDSIRQLSIEMSADQSFTPDQSEHLRILNRYIRCFAANLTHLTFRWIGMNKGPSPVSLEDQSTPDHSIRSGTVRPSTPKFHRHHPSQSLHSRSPSASSTASGTSTASTTSNCLRSYHASRSLQFTNLKYLAMYNATVHANQIAAFIHAHRHTLTELILEEIAFHQGNWDQALEPINRMANMGQQNGKAHQRRPLDQHLSAATWDVPCMMSPSITATPTNTTTALSTTSAATSQKHPTSLFPPPRPIDELIIADTLSPQPGEKEESAFLSAFSRLLPTRKIKKEIPSFLPVSRVVGGGGWGRSQFEDSSILHRNQDDERVDKPHHLRRLFKGNVFNWL